jgi:hypothetical protein
MVSWLCQLVMVTGLSPCYGHRVVSLLCHIGIGTALHGCYVSLLCHIGIGTAHCPHAHSPDAHYPNADDPDVDDPDVDSPDAQHVDVHVKELLSGCYGDRGWRLHPLWYLLLASPPGWEGDKLGTWVSECVCRYPPVERPSIWKHVSWVHHDPIRLPDTRATGSGLPCTHATW